MAKTCFVIMGFGKKVDWPTGRELDLDKTYRAIIKPAVEAAGLTCIRADEEQCTGVIDAPMYERLLDSDLVVADLSTGNANAFFELGVRYALRPHATIILAEDQYKPPFDVGHVRYLKYQHMGAGIDYEVVEQVRGQLQTLAERITTAPTPDSPVYVFLPGLRAPGRERADAVAVAVGSAEASGEGVTLASLREVVASARWDDAVARLSERLAAGSLGDQERWVRQQLALAIYKAAENALERREIDESALRDAYRRAAAVLEPLAPRSAADPETFGLWGAVHKRLFELELSAGNGEDRRVALDVAIESYEKGFVLLGDYYNGINYAYMLTHRAALGAGPAAMADFVRAQQVRERVLEVCGSHPLATNDPTGEARSDEERRQLDEARKERYWVLATAEEATFALGRVAEYEVWRARAVEAATKNWMRDTTEKQITKLGALLDRCPLGRDLAEP